MGGTGSFRAVMQGGFARRAFILRTSSCYARHQTKFDLPAKNCQFDTRRSNDQDHNPPSMYGGVTVLRDYFIKFVFF